MTETVLAVAAGLSTWLVMTPAAEASWSPTIGLSPAGWLGQDWPSVTVDRHGNTLLVWAACQTGQTECVYRVQVRTRSRSGRLGPVKTISPLRSADAAWPEAATDDGGNAAIVWENNSSQVMGRRISASGMVGPLHLLSTSAPAGTPKVVMTPAGTALAVWPENRHGSWYEVARYLFKNGSLGHAITLGQVVPDWPGVAVDRFGTAVVAWTEPNGSLVARRIKPGHVSAVKQIMAPGSGIGYGMVFVSDDRGGDAVICFLRSNNTGSGEPPHVWVRRWTQKGRLSAVLRISPPAGNVHFYHVVATDFAGDSMVLWSQWTSTTQTAVFGRRISRTGSLGPIIRLGPGDRPAIAVDDDGAGLAVWQGLSDSMGVSKVYARRFSSSGSFGPLLTLSSAALSASPPARWAGSRSSGSSPPIRTRSVGDSVPDGQAEQASCQAYRRLVGVAALLSTRLHQAHLGRQGAVLPQVAAQRAVRGASRVLVSKSLVGPGWRRFPMAKRDGFQLRQIHGRFLIDANGEA